VLAFTDQTLVIQVVLVVPVQAIIGAAPVNDRLDIL
jgi:hypothetical protein